VKVGVAVAIVAAGVVAVGCGGSPTAPSNHASSTFLSLTSSPGDLIGNGFSQRVGLADANFSAHVASSPNGRQVLAIEIVENSAAPRWLWTVRFVTGAGQPLQTGIFENVHSGTTDVTQPTMEFFGSGLFCVSSTSRVTVSEYTPGSGDIPDRAHLAFELWCTGASAPFKGEVLILANPWR
jgi:hypothetical protein